jgi:hypothetical protein
VEARCACFVSNLNPRSLTSRDELNVSAPRCCMAGVHRTVTIAGNPMHKVTGVRSVFLGADKGSGGASVLKASALPCPGDDVIQSASLSNGHNITLDVSRAVYPEKFTAGVSGGWCSVKILGTGAAREGGGGGRP